MGRRLAWSFVRCRHLDDRNGQSACSTNLVIDLFDGSNKKLLWRGLATEDLSSKADKNTRMVDGDIHHMFKDFPKAGK